MIQWHRKVEVGKTFFFLIKNQKSFSSKCEMMPKCLIRAQQVAFGYCCYDTCPHIQAGRRREWQPASCMRDEDGSSIQAGNQLNLHESPDWLLWKLLCWSRSAVWGGREAAWRRHRGGEFTKFAVFMARWATQGWSTVFRNHLPPNK